jgi:cytochrome c
MWRSPDRAGAGLAVLLAGAAILALPVFAQQPRPAAPATPAATTAAAPATPAQPRRFRLGREATAAEVAAWDIDVRPDGQGLPEGRGTAAQGEEVYQAQCAACHGEFGEGAGRWPALSGGRGSLGKPDPKKTVGSYWPYLSTVFDYTRRAMPFGNAQSLSNDELYAVTAYILYLNDIVTDLDFELNRANFTSVRMPNEAGFREEDTLDTPLARGGEPCMTECKPEARILNRARVLDVTPDGGGGRQRID